MRRGSQQLQETTLQLADLEHDLLHRPVQRHGKQIDLNAKELARLELMLRRGSEVLPKSLIASQVWDMNFASDTNVIEVAIRRLRAKLDDDHPHRLIHNVRRHGLRAPRARRRSAGLGSRMSLGVHLSLLFANCTAAGSPLAGLILSRAIDEPFVELDHMAMSAKLEVFRDELRGLGSEQ
ncbi:winged helix-turn-helix domain-containing protein, partial [Pseudomonas aeruginosa]